MKWLALALGLGWLLNDSKKPVKAKEQVATWSFTTRRLNPLNPNDWQPLPGSMTGTVGEATKFLQEILRRRGETNGRIISSKGEVVRELQL